MPAQETSVRFMRAQTLGWLCIVCRLPRCIRAVGLAILRHRDGCLGRWSCFIGALRVPNRRGRRRALLGRSRDRIRRGIGAISIRLHDECASEANLRPSFALAVGRGFGRHLIGRLAQISRASHGTSRGRRPRPVIDLEIADAGAFLILLWLWEACADRSEECR